MVQYQVASNKIDLEEILELQQLNLPKNISLEESKAQGFVTVEHDYDILAAMNAASPHVIAKADGKVVGYALVMLEQFKNQVPILIPMFERVNELHWKGCSLLDLKYFVMGQICIAKAWRGKGIFAGMYEHMKIVMRNDFDCVITEVATRNTRSMRAHEKVGFEILDIFESGDEEWAIVSLFF